MNCLEFRRLLGTDPASSDARFATHRAACAGCADAWSRAQGFEQALASALAVPVPEGLAERVLLRQLTETRVARRERAPLTAWRMAAGLVLALGAGVLLYGALRPPAALADVAVAHLDHEPYALAARGTVSADEVRAVFARTGTTLVAPPREVSYLQHCVLDGGAASVHMVVQEADGPVTVLYVADRAGGARSVFERRGVKGRLVPMGDGTLVLLGSHDGAFDRLEGEFREAIGGDSLAFGPDDAATPPDRIVMRSEDLPASSDLDRGFRRSDRRFEGASGRVL